MSGNPPFRAWRFIKDCNGGWVLEGVEVSCRNAGRDQDESLNLSSGPSLGNAMVR